MDSKDYSWRWVTASGKVSNGPCDLLYVSVNVGAANNNATLYDGPSTNAAKIAVVHTGSRTNAIFKPKEPVYCENGLYIYFSSNVDGAFVQWRELPRGGAEPEQTTPPG